MVYERLEETGGVSALAGGILTVLGGVNDDRNFSCLDDLQGHT